MSQKNSYGIKEVADTWFFPVGSKIKFSTTGKETNFTSVEIPTMNGTLLEYITYEGTYAATAPGVFIFDSLKVSNIEVASEETSAKGGKGNPELISWSYGKAITFTMTDALFNMQTLDLMFGAKQEITNGNSGLGSDHGITIDSNTFPDAYAIVGATYMRSYLNGEDEPFVFYIPKAKVNVGGTLTMEAEGDPTTFEMTIKALSAEVNNEQDVLIKFYKPNDTAAASGAVGSLSIN